MALNPDIATRLRTTASTAPAPQAKELEKAAKKLESFSRAPGDLKQAERIGAVLTPAVVEAMGEAFFELRREEIANPHPHFGPDFQQADYAFSALLIATDSPELEPAGTTALARVVDLIPTMTPQQAEHIAYLGQQFSHLAAAAAPRAAAQQVLAQQPSTEGTAWARDLGLALPDQFWSISLCLEPLLEDGMRWFDAFIYVDIANYPGDKTNWNIRIGTMNMNKLGGDSEPASYLGVKLGDYEREGFEEGIISGSITPPQSLAELPRVLAELEAAHPELRYDYAKLSASGRPGRLLSPTKKKLIGAWLARA